MFLTGLIHTVFDQEQVTEKFRKRILWLQEINAQYPNTWEITFINNDCSVLDSYKDKIGTLVNVDYAVQGKLIRKVDKEFVINTIRGLGIKKVNK